jgi:polyhydroxyalkanoate synthesis repressor PhaR
MVRLIKRYESRKLYDTEESRYVSLEDIAGWIRGGQEVRVIDNASSEDVTQQTLAQIILEEGRKGTSFLPSELLHELVRFGERAVHTGVEQLQHGVDRVLKASVDRLSPVRQAREEMALLRQRLEDLEGSLVALENQPAEGPASAPKAKSAPEATSAPKAAVTPKTTRKPGVPSTTRRGGSKKKAAG